MSVRKVQKYLQFLIEFTPVKKGGYVADVINLPGCMSQGETLKETKENIKDAIDAFLKVLFKERRETKEKVFFETLRKSYPLPLYS